MARWYLTAPHYLKVPGTEWQYMETDRASGRQKVKKFAVPLHLDPNDPGDCNYKTGIPNAAKQYSKDLATDLPFCVVAYDNEHAQGPDILFEGYPTPDMVPLDDEAAALTEQMKPQWVHPINDLPLQGGSQTYTESILNNLMSEMEQIQANQSPRQQIHDEAILEMMKNQQDTNDKLMAILAALVPAAKAHPERRV